MHDVDDWEWVARAQAGDEEAFAALVRRYETPLCHFCQRMTGSVEDGQELAQESFVRLYRSLKRLRPQAKFSTFLFGVARNLTLNFLRDHARRGRGAMTTMDKVALAAPEAQQPAARARAEEIRAAIEAAMDRLSPEHREILLLRETQGLEYEALARVLGCRKGTVRSRLARAREQLRLHLMEMGEDLL